MSDVVLIEDLQLRCIVGLHEWEQRLPRKLVMNLELGVDLRPAAASDAMADGVDYDAVCTRVTQICQATRYRLLETLGEHITRELLQAFPRIESVELTIRKPGAVSTARNVGVRLVRRR